MHFPRTIFKNLLFLLWQYWFLSPHTVCCSPCVALEKLFQRLPRLSSAIFDIYPWWSRPTEVVPRRSENCEMAKKEFKPKKKPKQKYKYKLWSKVHVLLIFAVKCFQIQLLVYYHLVYSAFDTFATKKEFLRTDDLSKQHWKKAIWCKV